MSTTTVIIVAIICLIAGFVIGFYTNKFVKSSKPEQVEQIRHILLALVAKAEKELGAGTGDLKLAQVYQEFTAQYPKLAEAITYDEFKELVKEVLTQFEDILNNNEAIKEYIEDTPATEV